MLSPSIMVRGLGEAIVHDLRPQLAASEAHYLTSGSLRGVFQDGIFDK